MGPETQVVYRIHNGTLNKFFRRGYNGFDSSFEEATVFLDKPSISSIRNTYVWEAGKQLSSYYVREGHVLLYNEADFAAYISSIKIIACVLTVVDSEYLSEREQLSLNKSMCKRLPVV